MFRYLLNLLAQEKYSHPKKAAKMSDPTMNRSRTKQTPDVTRGSRELSTSLDLPLTQDTLHDHLKTHHMIGSCCHLSQNSRIAASWGLKFHPMWHWIWRNVHNHPTIVNVDDFSREGLYPMFDYHMINFHMFLVPYHLKSWRTCPRLLGHHQLLDTNMDITATGKLWSEFEWVLDLLSDEMKTYENWIKIWVLRSGLDVVKTLCGFLCRFLGTLRCTWGGRNLNSMEYPKDHAINDKMCPTIILQCRPTTSLLGLLSWALSYKCWTFFCHSPNLKELPVSQDPKTSRHLLTKDEFSRRVPHVS